MLGHRQTGLKIPNLRFSQISTRCQLDAEYPPPRMIAELYILQVGMKGFASPAS